MMKRITWINLVLGIWLIISTLVIGYSAASVAVTNNIIIGVVIVACSWWMLAAMVGADWCGWLQLLCGIWLIIAPFALRYSGLTHVMGNDAIVGIIVFIVSLIETQAPTHLPMRTTHP